MTIPTKPTIAVIGDLDITWIYEQSDVASATSGRDFAKKQWRGGAFFGSAGLHVRQLLQLADSPYFASSFELKHILTKLTPSDTISNLERKSYLPIQALSAAELKSVRVTKSDKPQPTKTVIRQKDNLGWTSPDIEHYKQIMTRIHADVADGATPAALLIHDSTWGFSDDYHDEPAKVKTTFRTWLKKQYNLSQPDNTPIYLKYRTSKPIDFAPTKGSSVANYKDNSYDPQSTDVSPFDNELLVCLAVDDLRAVQIEISRSISWERTLQCVRDAVANNFTKGKSIPGLQECRYVVITFSSDGIVLIDKMSPDTVTLYACPSEIEGDNYGKREGRIFGLSPWVTTFFAAHNPLSQHGTERNNLLDQALIQSLHFMRTAVYEGHDRLTRKELKDSKFGYPAGSLAVSPIPAAPISSWKEPAFLKEPKGDFDLLKFEEEHHLRKTIHRFSRKPNSRVVSPNSQSGNPERYRKSWYTILGGQISESYSPKSSRELIRSYVQYATDVMRYGGPAEGEYFPDHVRTPYVKYGKFISCDRSEIESARSLAIIIKEYLSRPSDKPLSIAVFGAPGSGKSFTIKEMMTSMGIDKDIVFHTFNMSQFSSIDALPECFHFVQNEVLSGKLPVVFWDEFDTTLNEVPFGWLSAFLAPMQDGSFVHNNRINPLGQCIFVFAGSRFSQFEDLPDPTKPVERPREEIVTMSRREAEELGKQTEVPPSGEHELQRMEWRNLLRRRENWRLAKGNDFRSRLKGHLNVKESNLELVSINGDFVKFDGLSSNSCDLLNFLIRRAIFVRQHCLWRYPHLFTSTKCLFEAAGQAMMPNLDGRDCKVLRIEDEVVWGFLSPYKFLHGTRSMESVLHTSSLHEASSFDRSALAPSSSLEMHIDPMAFEKYSTLKDLVNHFVKALSPPKPIRVKPLLQASSHVDGIRIDWSSMASPVPLLEYDGVEVLLGPFDAMNPEDCILCGQDAQPPLYFKPSVQSLKRLGAVPGVDIELKLGLRFYRGADVGEVTWLGNSLSASFDLTGTVTVRLS